MRWNFAWICHKEWCPPPSCYSFFSVVLLGVPVYFWGLIIVLFWLVIGFELLGEGDHALSHADAQPGPQNDEEKELDDKEDQYNVAVVFFDVVVYNLKNFFCKRTVLVLFLPNDKEHIPLFAAIIDANVFWDTSLH